MKYFIVPFVLLASCASRPQPQLGLRPAPPPAVEPVDALRYGDVVRVYHVGRYVDPNLSTMHEQHPVYRVEASARWNLHPSGLLSMPILASLTNAAYSPVPTTDQITAELNRQRFITQNVTAEAGRLTESIAQFQQALAANNRIARQNQELRQQLQNALKRLDALEAKSPSNTPPEPKHDESDLLGIH
ncbi:MAG: hypothetical protein L0Y58_08530 [Verrucomicrobia subdivision 3 bacterium]|nr:hypothetical protein [Limisphaerales bacterium]